VKQTPGAIGYVELAYATQNRMNMAAVKNAAGVYPISSFTWTIRLQQAG
jgi:phosphate transport system substrate-binding protein